jgi:hypothetical protein
MKSGELWKLISHSRHANIIRTDDMSTLVNNNLEYIDMQPGIPVMLLEENTSGEYSGYWKVLVQDQVGWVHRTILKHHYQKIND